MYLAQEIGDPFRLLANCFIFLFLCRDLAVFIFPTLLAYTQYKVGTGSPHPVGRVIYSTCPLYSFTLNYSQPIRTKVLMSINFFTVAYRESMLLTI